MYCLCSDKSHDEIMEEQRRAPLSFELMINAYTRCMDGCGSCVEELRERFEKECIASDLVILRVGQ